MNPTIEDYQKLQPKYLTKAEEMFGPKTDYNFIGVFYHEYAPRTVLYEKDILTNTMHFMIQISRRGAENFTDGIFQLSHEVIHLLSPVEIDIEENEVNYLEEGMAVYFSKVITESETGDLDFCDAATIKHPKYLKAFELYLALISIDRNAVKKLRKVTPIIANIKPEDFVTANLIIPNQLIQALLTKFNTEV